MVTKNGDLHVRTTRISPRESFKQGNCTVAVFPESSHGKHSEFKRHGKDRMFVQSMCFCISIMKLDIYLFCNEFSYDQYLYPLPFLTPFYPFCPFLLFRELQPLLCTEDITESLTFETAPKVNFLTFSVVWLDVLQCLSRLCFEVFYALHKWLSLFSS